MPCSTVENSLEENLKMSWIECEKRLADLKNVISAIIDVPGLSGIDVSTYETMEEQLFKQVSEQCETIKQQKEKIDKLTRLLCYTCKQLKVADFNFSANEELLSWIKNHENEDFRRICGEDAEKGWSVTFEGC